MTIVENNNQDMEGLSKGEQCRKIRQMFGLQIPQERHDRSGGTARQSASNGISR